MAQLAANITRKPICVGPTAHQWRAFKLQWLLNKACNQNSWWPEDDPLNNSCNNEMIHTGKSTIANQQTRHAKSGFILQSQQAGSAKINFQWQKKGVTFHFENIWLTHTASHFPPNTGFEHRHLYGFDCNNKLRHSNNHPTWAFSLKSKKHLPWDLYSLVFAFYDPTSLCSRKTASLVNIGFSLFWVYTDRFLNE